MINQEHMVELGFTPEKFPVGTHICQIFSKNEERVNAIMQFLMSGLTQGERVACFSDKLDKKRLSKIIKRNNLSLRELQDNGDLNLAGTHDTYFKGNCFDPARMLDTLEAFHRKSLNSGYTASRVIGEMPSTVQDMQGGDRLLEYESRVSLLMEKAPVTVVCQYDSNEFSGATIMDILKVHPHMFINGSVLHNPFYIRPTSFLA